MNILAVDDDSDHLTFLQGLLRGWGHNVKTASCGEDALDLLSSFRANVMITDLHMPGMDGFELMRSLKADGRLPPTIVLTAFGSIDRAINTVHEYGGFWYLEKPLNGSSLRALVDRAGEAGRLSSENELLRLELLQRGVLGDLVGASPEMLEIFALIRQVAGTSAAVMITGESGSGKELAARAIHNLSPRSSGPFLALNCAALPETLIESELFGHEKGSFTGAADRRAGAMELANGGTLFLDEIGEMPISMQAKLLRVLEDFKFRRLGGKTEIVTDIRLISATNRAPAKAIGDGKLREDLFYRLNVFHIEMPPLRSRLEDIPLIASAMIEKLNKKHGSRVTHLDSSAIEALQSQKWEGNVRELRNTIERAVILAGEGPILRTHLFLQGPALPKAVAPTVTGLGIRVGMSIEEGERIMIEATLRQHGNNKTKAAAILGISAKTLHAKVRQYRLEADDELPEAAERMRAPA
jgi:DNA-binding NtrC family response regulator